MWRVKFDVKLRMSDSEGWTQPKRVYRIPKNIGNTKRILTGYNIAQKVTDESIDELCSNVQLCV